VPTLAITKTYDTGNALTETDLDNIKTSVEDFVNSTKLATDNIQTAGVETINIADANVTLAKLASAVAAALVPAGGVLAYGGTSAPTGYLMCDGSAVSRSTYAALFAVIGIAHGNGNGTTTFTLPDYRGRFLRGVDSGQSRDPDAASRTAMATGGNAGDAVGSVQGNATKKNGLALTDPGHTHPVTQQMNTGGAGVGLSFGALRTDQTDTFIRTTSSTTGITLGSGDSETRPVNANVYYIIKT
jgi:microcystin-dependent protein